jgi:hypothetical protein
MKKKIQLKKEIISKLDSIKGGDSQITQVSTIYVVTDGAACEGTTVLASAAMGPACAPGTIILLSARHCPTAQTDCDTCICYSRWCGV